MAKKKPQLRMTLDAEFMISVAGEAIEKLKTELTKGKACMSISIPYGDEIEYMMSIYIDHFKDGDMKISSYENGMAKIIAKGDVIRDLDPSFDAEFIEALKSEGPLKIMCSDVCDNDVNSYYIDGNDDTRVKIGECGLVS